MRSMVVGASKFTPLPPHFVRSPSPTFVGEEKEEARRYALRHLEQ
jgi:hypothetical protein